MKEYFLFDPRAEYLTPRLQGYRLAGDEYERLPAVETLDRALVMTSEVLGLELRAKAGGKLRFGDPETGEDLLSHGETHAALRAAELRAEREGAALRATLRAAEARIAELEARLREGG